MSLPPRKPEHIPAGKLYDELYNRKHQVNPQQVVDKLGGLIAFHGSCSGEVFRHFGLGPRFGRRDDV
jgi:hypothetical protein